MYLLTTVVFSMILYVDPVEPVVMVVLIVVVMVVRLLPLTAPGVGIRASTEADLSEMPTFATLVTFRCFT